LSWLNLLGDSIVEQAQVAALADIARIQLPIGVFALCSQFRSPVLVVAILTQALRVVLLGDVFAFCYHIFVYVFAAWLFQHD